MAPPPPPLTTQHRIMDPRAGLDPSTLSSRLTHRWVGYLRILFDDISTCLQKYVNPEDENLSASIRSRLVKRPRRSKGEIQWIKLNCFKMSRNQRILHVNLIHFCFGICLLDELCDYFQANFKWGVRHRAGAQYGRWALLKWKTSPPNAKNISTRGKKSLHQRQRTSAVPCPHIDVAQPINQTYWFTINLWHIQLRHCLCKRYRCTRQLGGKRYLSYFDHWPNAGNQTICGLLVWKEQNIYELEADILIRQGQRGPVGGKSQNIYEFEADIFIRQGQRGNPKIPKYLWVWSRYLYSTGTEGG